MRLIQGIIEVEEILDIVSEGVTLPVKCRLQNNIEGIVKYMKNPFGQKVLINEFVGYSIADLIDLTIPQYGICNVSKEVIVNTNNNEEIDDQNSGLGFFTKLHPKTVPGNTLGILALVSNKETEKIVLFDHIVNNCDRHFGNLLIDIGKVFTLYVIDNSHIIISGTDKQIDEELRMESILSPLVLKKNQDVYSCLYKCLGFSEEKLLLESRFIKNQLTHEKMLEIKNDIPEMWIKSENREYVNKMFEVINMRIDLLGSICDIIIEERGNING